MPSRHGMIDVDRGLPASLPLLTEELHAHGYQTAAVTVGANFEPNDGYDRGVDFFWVTRQGIALGRCRLFSGIVFREFPALRGIVPKRQIEKDPTSPEVITSRVLEFVERSDPARPLFVFAHYLGPHDPYAPPPPFDRAFSPDGVVERLTRPPDDLWAGPDALSPADRQQMIDQYDGEIVWNDAAVGRLVDGLRAAGRLDNAMVVVTADQGEGIGEHGMWSHNVSLFEEVVRIPLVVWSSAPWNAGRELAVPASLLDLAPTMLEAAGAPAAPGFDGESLLPWLDGRNASTERVVHLDNPLNGELGVRTPEWAYFEEKRFGKERRWLYRADDLRQERELLAQEPAVADRLAALSRERWSRDLARHTEAPKIELDEARKEQLRALGYIE
jgi:arylsulfatase